ncbi:MAG TPA: hypothetical protein VGR90_03390 [Acidimicrobiales bacterium]|nr:hypothetical protein [Acidimicrobiales bacterium]
MRALGECQAGVYAAEVALDSYGMGWRRVPQAQSYLDRLVGSEWMAERWPELAGAVVERRGSGAVWSAAVPEETSWPGGPCRFGRILLAGRDLRQAVLLHELAHLLVHPDDTHGAPFVRTHLELVRHEMGFLAFVEYREALLQQPALAAAL